MSEGTIFLLIGPSAAGKNTVQESLLNHFPWLHMAKGCWTRPHRPGETDETADSKSIDEQTFRVMHSNGMLTAVNHVHGFWYGTSKAEFSEPLKRGQSVVRIVTDEGARAVKRDFPDKKVVTIYLEVPLSVTVERLLARGDAPESIVRRVKTAEAELKDLKDHRWEWTHIIDATQSPETVAARVIEIVTGYMKSRVALTKVMGYCKESTPGTMPNPRIVNHYHQAGMYQLCPCDDCQKQYAHSPGSRLLNRPEYARGHTSTYESPLPACHSCEETKSDVVINSVALCRDCLELAGSALGR